MIFFHKESKSKKKNIYIFYFFFGGEGGRGIDGWTDEQAQTNLPPSTSSKLEA